jgi:hypothetical protein
MDNILNNDFSSFSYIRNNKKEMLPQVFTFVNMYILLLLPIPISATLLFWLYIPFFGYFFFRALAKTEKDNLSLKHKILICMIFPFMALLVCFIIHLTIHSSIYGLTPIQK